MFEIEICVLLLQPTTKQSAKQIHVEEIINTELVTLRIKILSRSVYNAIGCDVGAAAWEKRRHT